MSKNFIQLFPELIIKILEFCCLQDIYSLKNTCRTMNLICSSQINIIIEGLKTKIPEVFNGLEKIPKSLIVECTQCPINVSIYSKNVFKNLIYLCRDNKFEELYKFNYNFPNFIRNINPYIYTIFWPEDITLTKFSFDSIQNFFMSKNYNCGKHSHDQNDYWLNIHFFHVILSFFIPEMGQKSSPIFKYYESNYYRKKLIKDFLLADKDLVCDYNLEKAVKIGDIQTVECLIECGVNLKDNYSLKIAIIKDSVQQRIKSVLKNTENIDIKRQVVAYKIRKRMEYQNVIPEELLEEKIDEFYRNGESVKQKDLYGFLYHYKLFLFSADLIFLANEYDYYESLGGILQFNFEHYDTYNNCYFKIIKILVNAGMDINYIDKNRHPIIPHADNFYTKSPFFYSKIFKNYRVSAYFRSCGGKTKFSEKETFSGEWEDYDTYNKGGCKFQNPLEFLDFSKRQIFE